MSDVLIKNIQIPKDNKRLALFIDKDGEVTVFDGNEFNRFTDAIEVPPHGRLGDLDKLQKKVEDCAFVPEQSKTMYMLAVEKEVKNAPTIIEASKERE